MLGPLSIGAFERSGVEVASTLLNDIIAYWKMDEASGARADSVGDNDLTDNNTVGSGTGIINNAAQFVFANNEYLSHADDPDLSLGDTNFTINCWVNFATNSHVSNSYGIVVKHSGDPREYALFLHANNDQLIKFRVYGSDNSQVGEAVASALGIPVTDTWYMLTAWHDVDNDEIGLAVNAGTPVVNATTGAPGNTAATFLISGLSNGSGHFLDGMADEVGLWRRVLNSSERDELYNGGSGNAYPFDSPPAEGGAGTWDGDEWSIIWLPDTQLYSRDNPEIFDAQTQWIADNQATHNVKLVMHVGDLVQSYDNDETEWQEADGAMDILDAANIPYLAAIGNHDYSTTGVNGDRTATFYNSYFGQSRYTGQSWWNGGFKDDGAAENKYLLMTIEGKDYIFLSLELFPRDAVVTWADGILTTHADRDAIVMTHAYMYSDDTRLEDPDDNWGPDDYGLEADANDGEELWVNLIKNHDNIIWVQNGHVLNDGIGRLKGFSDGGYSVHQILYNNQEPIISDQVTEGGYLQIMTIKPSKGQIAVETYSPWLDDWKTDTDHQYSVNYREQQ